MSEELGALCAKDEGRHLRLEPWYRRYRRGYSDTHMARTALALHLQGLQMQDAESQRAAPLVRPEALKAADGAEADKEGKEQRCLDVLKHLQRTEVNTSLLMETEAAKKLKRLTKHAKSAIASAAGELIRSWKATVTKEAAAKATADKPTVGVEVKEEQEAPAAPNVPTTPTATPSTGDAARDKLAVSLGDALAKVVEELGADAAGLADPAMVGIAIEAAMAKKFGGMSKEYKAKYRSISFNLKDARNPDLRRKVLEGDISPYTLLTLSPEELASNEKRDDNAKIREAMLADNIRGQTNQASTDQFKCGKCGQRKCTYYQLQTRSADEPMTTFVTCTNCNNRWKFC